jgi:hypothetical protein
MAVAGAAGLLGTAPPRRVVDEAVEQAPGPDPSSPTRNVLATGLHLIVGGVMALGIVPLLVGLRGAGPRFRRHVAAGAALGVSLYVLNYAGLAPALGILPPPTRDRPGRQPTMLAAHLVYGIVLGAVVDALEPALDARPETTSPSTRP